MMAKIIIKILKKNIITINIIIFFVGALFFYLNKNNFDTYKTYIEYNFQEKMHLNYTKVDENMSNFIFQANKIQFFLNDLDFNKKFYGIDDLKYENSDNKINVNIDHKNQEVIFTFDSKKKNISSMFFKNNNFEDLLKKNNETTNNFIKENLNKFHNKLYENIDKEIKFQENKLTELTLSKSQETRDAQSIEISDTKYFISSLKKFLGQRDELIIVNGYKKKFKRDYLSSTEYVVSFLILLILINLLIRYSNKIFK